MKNLSGFLSWLCECLARLRFDAELITVKLSVVLAVNRRFKLAKHHGLFWLVAYLRLSCQWARNSESFDDSFVYPSPTRQVSLLHANCV